MEHNTSIVDVDDFFEIYCDVCGFIDSVLDEETAEGIAEHHTAVSGINRDV